MPIKVKRRRPHYSKTRKKRKAKAFCRPASVAKAADIYCRDFTLLGYDNKL